MAVIEMNDVSGLATFEQLHFLLGYGVEDPESGIHGDEKYLYVVKLPSHGPFTCDGDRIVRVSKQRLPEVRRPNRGSLRSGDVAVRGHAARGARRAGHRTGLMYIPVREPASPRRSLK